MKVVNKIMIGIAVLCLLLCGGILVFALNPDMTSSLAQKLYGNTVDMPPGTEETGEGQTSGNGNISVTLPNGMPGEMNGYVAPSMDQMQIPEDVSGRTGFTPVQPEEQQIPDQEAQNLKETLGSGETGEGLSFSAEEYPYYQMLSENQQSVYRQIYANAQNLTEKFAPEKTVSASDVKTAFEAVIDDHPEMFWLETGYSSKYLANGQCVEIDLKYNGYYNVDVTWDDAAAIRYDYFNKTDADFASTHVRQNLSVYLPACNGTAYRQENTTGAAGTGQPSEAGGATPDPDAGTTPSGGQTDGSVTDPGQQGDGTQEPEQPGSSLSDYINPDPQEPLRYPSGNTAGSAGNTTAAATPEPRADALTDLSSYYEDCRKQLTGLGSGDQHFDNVVPKSLWSTIEQSYHTGAYEQGYVVDVLKNLGMEYFAIQLQLVDIGDGYYRVYHNVVTY